MAKVIRNLREDQKEFQKIFSGLCDSKSSWQVWADFIECAAISISNSVDRDSSVRKDREERYIRIMKTYRKKEQECFPQLFAVMVNAMEKNPDQDFLGEMFMALELGNHWKGQFFTPYNICRMMAKLQADGAKQMVESRGWIGINDPACGAGALLIAARNEFLEQGIGYRQTLYVCQDIDHVAGLMCYIQLSMLGCAGYVVIADTLANPLTGVSLLLPAFNENQDVWFMPMIYDAVWQTRVRLEITGRTLRGLLQTHENAVATPQEAEEQADPSDDKGEPEPPVKGLETEVLAADETGQLKFF